MGSHSFANITPAARQTAGEPAAEEEAQPATKKAYSTGRRLGDGQEIHFIEAKKIGIYIHKGIILAKYLAGGKRIFYYDPETQAYYDESFVATEPEDLLSACLQFSGDDHDDRPDGGGVALPPEGSIIKLGELCTCKVGPSGIYNPQTLVPHTLAYLLSSAPSGVIAAFVNWVLASDDSLDDLEENDRLMLLSMLPALAMRWEQRKAEEGDATDESAPSEDEEPELSFSGTPRGHLGSKLRLFDSIQYLLRNIERLQRAGGAIPGALIDDLREWAGHLESLIEDRADWWPPQIAAAINALLQKAQAQLDLAATQPANPDAFQAELTSALAALAKARTRLKHMGQSEHAAIGLEQQIGGLQQAAPTVGDTMQLQHLSAQAQELASRAGELFEEFFRPKVKAKRLDDKGALNTKGQEGINPKSMLEQRIKARAIKIGRQHGNFIITLDAWNQIPAGAQAHFLAALQTGSVSGQGMQGIKAYNGKPYTHELKILGANGDMRILGIKIGDKIYFIKFVPHSH